MSGKIWLVGAGPGDVGLLTRKGYDVLQKAEVVVYDSLLSDSILAMIPDSAEKIDAGKRAGNHKLQQEETNRILLQKALEGKQVVRLKGGDPFLFGRGGEELELPVQQHVEYEVVPGVTSAIAVPAYNGIPVSHRDYCSSVHIITGHKKKNDTYDIDFEALVRTKGTLIFLMGIAALSDICQNLIKAGMNPDMPAAVLQEGTTANQRRVVATVSTLWEAAEKADIKPPGIIVVGKVCELSKEYGFVEEKPLFGRKILVTRPKELSSSMAQRLREEGAEVVEIPLIQTKPVENREQLSKAVREISKYQWIAFTSPTGVRIFFQMLMELSVDIRALAHLKFAVLGAGTNRELRGHGIIADVMPDTYDGASLGEAIAKAARPGDRIFLPRAAKGNQELLDKLQAYEVADVPLYDTVAVGNDIVDVQKEFEDGRMHLVAFTSSSSVRAFVNAYPNLDYSKVQCACIGKCTMDTAASYGMKCFMSKEAAIDSLIERIIWWSRS